MTAGEPEVAATRALVIDNIGSLITNDPTIGRGPLGILEHACVVIVDGAVTHVGSAGAIAVGQRADLVSVSLGSVRTAGARDADAIEATVFAASASDVTDVVVDGRQIVTDGRHVEIDVAAELHAAITELMDR